MTKRELERLIFGHPGDVRVVTSRLSYKPCDILGECALMHLVEETGDLYLKAENAQKDGKETERVLVLFLWEVNSETEKEIANADHRD